MTVKVFRQENEQQTDINPISKKEILYTRSDDSFSHTQDNENSFFYS